MDVDTPFVIFLQYAYEFSAFCTSAVIRTLDGTIIHNRNLDFADAQVMTKITYVAKFMNGEEELFEGTMFAGYNAVITGIKKDAFSISLNTRKPSWRSDFTILLGNIVAIFSGKK